MHDHFHTLLLLSCLSGISSSPLSAGPAFSLQVKEQTSIPHAWTQVGQPDGSSQIKLQIALKQPKISELRAKVDGISNPKSSNFRKWLSREDIKPFMTPSNASMEAVRSWIASVVSVSEAALAQPASSWIEVDLPISDAERPLNARYALYSHDSISQPIARTLSYSVPDQIASLVDTIQPTTVFHENLSASLMDFETQSPGHRHIKRETCPGNVTPACLKSFYNVDYASTAQSYSAVTGFGNLGSSHADAAYFFTSCAPGTPDFIDISVAGGANDDSASGEGNLDMQWLAALTSPSRSSFLAVSGGGNFADALVNLGVYLNNADDPPAVVSSSYGAGEETLSSEYMDRICNEYMAAGARGISAIFASGDSGVGAKGQTSCTRFHAAFPASCPYVTSVGGTQFGSDGSDGEEVAQFPFSGIGSNTPRGPGGGFSDHFFAPDYQSEDTSSYIAGLNGEYGGMHNPSGRGFPDVALLGRAYRIVVNGNEQGIAGTSASAPAFAGLVGLLNDFRISEAQGTLGFLNPFLYSIARNNGGLRDITVGSNRGCGGEGWEAKDGWDPASGLGSLDFAGFRALI